MAALGVYAVFKDLFGGLVAAYVFVLGFIIAFPAPSLLREVLGGVFGSDDRVASVVGAAAVAGLAYLYIYGVDADLIGLWVMAGPLAEFFLVRQAVVLGGGDSLPDLGVHAYSVAASLTFLPHPLLGAYAVLANSVKGVVRGRHAFVAVVADYLVRVLLLVYLNLGRIPVPVSEGLGW